MPPENEPYRRIVEHFPDGIVFLYEGYDDPRYTFVGGEGLAELGLTKADLEGRPVAEDRPADVKETIRSHYREALDGDDISFDAHAEGRHFHFRLMPVRDDTGTVRAGVGIARDVTEERIYKAELERQNERLQRYSELLFHDVRSPLNVAMGHLQDLDAECDSDHIEPIQRALERIDSLTSEEIGDATAEETLDAVDLEAVANAAWRNVATQDATLTIETDQTVRADENELRRVFANLYRNAVRHGGADVAVRVGTLEGGFVVEDDGRGIPEDERDAVFDRGHSGTSEGTGLGLFYVESVAERWGWFLTVTESSDGGARFEFTGVTIVE